MTSGLSNFALRLREFIADSIPAGDDVACCTRNPEPGTRNDSFSALALELFALQFSANPAYRRICEARNLTPLTVSDWTQIPAVPTAAFKELELTCLPPAQRTHVFHSSGTTAQTPSRHFHNAESLALYEASLWTWFKQNLRLPIGDLRLAILTPPLTQAPHSSLVHMFEVVRQKLGAPETTFQGRVATDGSWALDCEALIKTLPAVSEPGTRNPQLILGTAFSFVHLLDHLAAAKLRFQLPPGSRVLETGGYKGRSREIPKAELHALITHHLGVPRADIVCEYGMSELSSQAYDTNAPVGVQASACSPSTLKRELQPDASALTTRNPEPGTRPFRFPPWTRAQIISPETGREVAEGGTGLLRVLDLANVFSVMAIQTEDLAVRRGDGFELLGRAVAAEPRGCSLMPA